MAGQKTREHVGSIQATDFNSTPVLLAAILGFLLIALFLYLRRRSSARRDFLLMGLSDSGKSAIFVQLLHQKFPTTFTSMKETVGEYQSGRLSGRLVDIPGHYRVREKCFDRYKPNAKGIIYTVDSVTISKDIRDVADAFYTVLADSSVQTCPLLVLCNKQDLPTAKSAQIIKSMLEKEINIVRETRSRKLKSLGEELTTEEVYLGRAGRDFEFAHLTQNVQFYDCSAKENKLTNLSDWIDRML